MKPLNHDTTYFSSGIGVREDTLKKPFAGIIPALALDATLREVSNHDHDMKRLQPPAIDLNLRR